MDHLAGYLIVAITVLAVLRMATGALTGFVLARILPPAGSRGGHVLAGLAGGVVIPVLAEKIFGAPMSLINPAMGSTSGMVLLIAYIIGFSAVSAALGVWLYRNVRLTRRSG